LAALNKVHRNISSARIPGRNLSRRINQVKISEEIGLNVRDVAALVLRQDPTCHGRRDSRPCATIEIATKAALTATRAFDAAYQ